MGVRRSPGSWASEGVVHVHSAGQNGHAYQPEERDMRLSRAEKGEVVDGHRAEQLADEDDEQGDSFYAEADC